MKYCILLALIAASITAFAEPAVVVLPFDPVMDSLYVPLGGKESILDYRRALQEMLTVNLGKYVEIRIVEPALVTEYIKNKQLSPASWNNPALAGRIASDLSADYAIIGTYGEYSNEIRADARIVIAATADVPPGNMASATARLWQDLPTVADKLAAAIVPIVTASGRVRPTSKGVLYPEGDLAAYDPTGTAAPDKARLVVWINAPAPVFELTPSAQFQRCERVDLMDAPIEKQRAMSCRSALVPGGPFTLKVTHRGYLPYVEELNLAAGKAYRLEINLKPVDVPVK